MSVWEEAKRGDIWVDSKKREHLIVGVVDGGFDAVCEGVVENIRESIVVGSDFDSMHAFAKAKDEGKGYDDAVKAAKAAAPKWVDLDDTTYAAVEGWKRKGA